MVTLSDIDTKFFTKFPVGQSPAAFPDVCKLMSPTQDISDNSAFGHLRTTETTIASSIPCRVEPVMGKFNRVEDVFRTNAVTADYLIFMPYQSNIKEGYYLQVTSSGNTSWVNAKFDLVLVMDASGNHKVHICAANQIKTS